MRRTWRRISFRRAAHLTIFAVAAIAALEAAQAKPPAAPVRPMTETLHGITVTDPYRWMETPGDPTLSTWLTTQSQFARQQLDALPGRSRLFQRIRELTVGSTVVTTLKRGGDRLFFLRADAGRPVAKLLVRETDGRERVLFDPIGAPSAPGAAHQSIDNFAPSPDGRLVAVNVAEGGGEVTRVRVIEVETGKRRPEIIERIWGESSVTWMADGSGFVYAQMQPPKPGVDPQLGQRLRYHSLGATVDNDPVVLGPDVNTRVKIEPREFPGLLVFPGSPWALAVAGGARLEARTCAAKLTGPPSASTPWTCITAYEDLVQDGVVHGDNLYVLSSKDAPNGRVLRVSLLHPSLAEAEVVVPQRSDRVITKLAGARDALYFTEMHRGIDRVGRLPWGARDPDEVPLPLHGTADPLLAQPDRDGFLVWLQDWTHRRAWFAFEPSTRKIIDLNLRSAGPGAASTIEVESVDVKSFDGADVPLDIIHQAGAKWDGTHPAILLGYGAYGITMQPQYNPFALAWVERGGVGAVAHVRGGGAKGRAWYLAGKGPNKMNGVRDFIACAEYLIAHGYTSRGRLGAYGASAGGVLIGRVITERPDLFASAGIQAGVLNPLRLLAGTNGANQIPEFGSPEDEAGFKNLLAMDPYQHIRDGVPYPAVLLMAGLNDNRVSPWHTGKVAARLQIASSSGKPVLVRIDEDAGHGFGSTRDQEAARWADFYAFVLWQSGDPGFQPARQIQSDRE